MSSLHGTIYLTVYLVSGAQFSAVDTEAVEVALKQTNETAEPGLRGVIDGDYVGPRGEPGLAITLLAQDFATPVPEAWDELHGASGERWASAQRFAASLREILGDRFGVDVTSELI